MGNQEYYARLIQAVVNYEASGAEEAARTALAAGIPAVEVVAGLAEGMREIGRLWNTLEVFLPEVMAATDAYYAGLSVVQPVAYAGNSNDAIATIIIGTVYGDIHTVGKDIVVPVFQAENFNVIDLGVDVSPERYINAIKQHRAHVVGLGTYMSETFMHVDDMVRHFEEAGVRDQVLIVCGGPAVDAEAARRMGADDAYSDAWVAVARVKALLGARGMLP